MKVELRLRTGFYETTSYWMDVIKNRIVLTPQTPDAGKEKIVILGEAIAAVTILEKKNPEIEIQTKGGTFFGTLAPETDLDKLFNQMKKELKKKVIYEGGIGHA
ncbi:hypothetical protein SDC9_56532 [bioreactor metagenome]|uniref:Uncharacterized protein n=1 Tax=bioreactor metagenome TaxID=1076179 RepID=A0A644X219_9ZZZZ